MLRSYIWSVELYTEDYLLILVYTFSEFIIFLYSTIDCHTHNQNLNLYRDKFLYFSDMLCKSVFVHIGTMHSMISWSRRKQLYLSWLTSTIWLPHDYLSPKLNTALKDSAYGAISLIVLYKVTKLCITITIDWCTSINILKRVNNMFLFAIYTKYV